MLRTYEREKLCEAIAYFAHNTRKLGKTKLFKLLYFLDFEHFKQTGRSVTGSHYYAWPKGPVPVDLFNEFERPAADLLDCVSLEEIPTMHGKMLKVSPNRQFNPRYFTKRELRLLESLAARYRDATADEMIEETHLENRPWHEVYEVQGKRQDTIPYSMALSRQEKDEMLKHIREREELLRNYKER